MLELVCRATRYEPAVTRQVRAVRAKQVQGGHNGRTFYEAQDAHSGEWIAFCKADNGPLVRRGALPAFQDTDFGAWRQDETMPMVYKNYRWRLLERVTPVVEV